MLKELTGRARYRRQTSDTHVTAKIEPWQTYFDETVTNLWRDKVTLGNLWHNSDMKDRSTLHAVYDISVKFLIDASNNHEIIIFSR